MKISVHGSARRHGVSDADIVQAATWPMRVEPHEEEDLQRESRLGFDTNGRLLEVVVLIFDSGCELVVHAMKAGRHH